LVRLVGGWFLGSTIFILLEEVVCQLPVRAKPTGATSYCDIPQPEGFIVIGVLALLSWSLFSRRRLPPLARRITAIVAYGVVAFATAVILASLILSRDCTIRGLCSGHDTAPAVVLFLALFVALICIVVLGSIGQLPGTGRQ